MSEQHPDPKQDEHGHPQPEPSVAATDGEVPQTSVRLKRWTAEEYRLLGTAPDDEIAMKLGRTRVAVTVRRCALRIASANAQGPILSKEQQAEAAAPDPKLLDELDNESIAVPRESLDPVDEERFKLLYGPYYPPRTRKGGFLVCEWRGTIKVGGYSDAPIPWPYAFRTGYRSLILCGDLARAVKLESEQAIAYHWKVSATTVGKWRKILGVEQFNAGTTRLYWRAIDLARTPEAREKISRAATGRSLSPEHQARLKALNRRPKSEEFKKQLSEKMRRRFASGTVLERWTPEEEALLGTMPDRDLARRLGRSIGAVAARRFLKQAGRLADPSLFSWSHEQDELLKTQRPKDAAQLLGRPLKVIQARRRTLGLLPLRPTVKPWTPVQDEIVRAHPAQRAAELLERSIPAIESRRRKLGVATPKTPSRPWAPKEINLLGTKPDPVLARKFKRPTTAVQQKRKSLGIPLCPARHFWRPVDDNLLGKYADQDVARLLKISAQAVKTRRANLGIPVKNSKRRPWTPEELQFLGTAADDEVAKKLERSVSAVRCKRIETGRACSASKIKYWTAAEDEFLKVKPDEEVARLLGRSLGAVKLRRSRLGLSKDV